LLENSFFLFFFCIPEQHLEKTRVWMTFNFFSLYACHACFFIAPVNANGKEQNFPHWVRFSGTINQQKSLPVNHFNILNDIYFREIKFNIKPTFLKNSKVHGI